MAGAKSSVTRDCYGKVPNKEKHVDALSTQTGCYFPLAIFNQLFKGQIFPRCGVCAEVTGPGLKKGICTMVGAVQMSNVTSPLEQLAAATTFFLEDSLFNYLSGYQDDTPGVTIPMVGRIVSCPYKTVPNGVVTEITTENEESIAQITLFNTNLVVNKIEYEKKFYYLDPLSCQYSVPFNSSSTTGIFRLHNLFGNIVQMPFKFELNKIQQASSTFIGNIKDAQCYLRPSHGVIGTYVYPDPVFSWTTRIHPTLNLSVATILPKTSCNFSFDGEVYISFAYPYPIKLSQHYSHFSAQYTLTEPPTEIPVISTYSFIGRISKAVENRCEKPFIYEVNSTLVENVIHFDVKSSIKIAKCNSQLNLFVWHIKTDKPTTMHIYDFHLVPINEINFTKCPFAETLCNEDDECDPTNSTIDSPDGMVRNRTVGCVPYCGKCKTGYYCNKAAHCVSLPTLNTRSGTTSIQVVILLFILLLI